MQRTDIEWTDYSSNPLKLKLRKSGKLVNACVKCSPGCGNCYAESITRRYWPSVEGRFPGYTPALMKLGDIVLNEAELKKLLTFKPKPPFKNGDTPMVFIEDMGDIGGEWVPFELLDKLFAVFALRPDVIFQILTKRIERMAEYLKLRVGMDNIAHQIERLTEWKIGLDTSEELAKLPLRNVWLATSIENKSVLSRIDHLRRCPAAIRFLSLEPLLEDLGVIDLTGIHWVVVGGESGHGTRPCNVEWVRSIINQCKVASVPIFVKQLGKWIDDGHGGTSEKTKEFCVQKFLLNDGSTWIPPLLRAGYSPLAYDQRPLNAVAFGLADVKGGDPTEWPLDLRIREFPELSKAGTP